MNIDSCKNAYTEKFDQFYTRFANIYNVLVKIFPTWRRWIGQVLPHANGSRILEISFGTGYLFDFYNQSSQVFGLEYNRKMIDLAKRKILKANRRISLQQGDVYYLPFKSETFDTVVNTMAFTGYQDGKNAIAEMNRVLKPGGKLVMVDINFPRDNNRMGVQLTRLWIKLGDIVRDMDAIFREGGFTYTDKEIGGWGSVHLYIATKGSQK